MSKKRYLALFVFKHKKLTDKARCYQHELFHIIQDLMRVRDKVQRNSLVCFGQIESFGSKTKIPFMSYGTLLDQLDEVRMDIENFVFRIQPYREKLCLFVNYSLKTEYPEEDRELLKHLLVNTRVKDSLLRSELGKLNKEPISILNSRRVEISHRPYFNKEIFSQHFIPIDESKSPSKIGTKRASKEWKKNLNKEIKLVEKSLEIILKLNSTISKKIIAYLNKK